MRFLQNDKETSERSIFLIVLLVLLALLALPSALHAQSASDFATTISNGQVAITGYSGAAKAVVIPSTINGLPVTEISDAAFYLDAITSVTFPSTVTKIDFAAFASCTSLTSVTIPDNVTLIDQAAFAACSSLTSVNIGNGVTAIGQDAFAVCTSLTSVTIPSNVTLIDADAFNGCSALTSVTLNSGLTDIESGAFAECPSLATVTIPDSVTNIGDEAFYDCVNLGSVTIGSGVTSIGDGAFFGCDSLTEVTVPANVTSIGSMAFGSCISLTAITVSAQNPAYSSLDGVLFSKDGTILLQFPAGLTGHYAVPDGVTRIEGEAFYDCTGLTSVFLPSGLLTIGDDAFDGCTGLTAVTIPASVIGIEDIAFYGCTNLHTATFLGDAPNMGSLVFGAAADNFTVSYSQGAQGFGSPWTDSSGDVYQITGSGSTSGPSAGVVAQTITFGALADKTFGDAAFAVSATASSGLPVSFSIVSGPATVSGSKVTLTGAGTVTVSANQAGNANYNPATPVTRSFTVNKRAQTIAAFTAVPTKTFSATPFTIKSPTASSSLPVAVSVQSGPATISGNSVTMTGTGTVVLAADQSGSANYLAASTVTTTFTINGASQKISAFAKIANKTYSATPFNITLPTSSAGMPVDVTVQSGPATISGNSVTMTGVGTVVLAANQAGNSDVAAATEVTTSFTISKGTQTISAFAPITGITFGIAPFTITLPTSNASLPVDVTVLSGPATISGNTVTVTGIGPVTLAADQPGTALINAAKEVTVKFTVGKELQTISAFDPIATQTYGAAPFTINLPTATSNLTVTTTVKSGPAKLVGNLLTLTGAGTVVLSASQSGDATFAAAPVVTTSFVINKTPQNIAAFATIPDANFGDPAFTITAPTSDSGLTVTVKVLSGPAKIMSNKVTITGGGTVVLAANQAGNATIAPAAQVTTSFLVHPKAQTIAAFNTIADKVFTPTAFSVPAPKATSNLAVVLSVVSGPATITAGKVTLSGTGTVVIAADQAGNANYAAAQQVTTSFNVTMASQTISAFRAVMARTSSAAPFTITLPTATSKLPVTVTVLSGPATISGNTVTLTGATGTVMLAADQAGDARYNAAPEVTTSFQVK